MEPMDLDTVIARLQERMSSARYQQLCDDMRHARNNFHFRDETIYDNILYPEVSQYGLKVQIKYNCLMSSFMHIILPKFLTNLHHVAVWVDNKIYHWGADQYGKKWQMYGEEETRENNTIFSYSQDGILYTLRTHQEIEEFCDKWRSKYYYDFINKNCHTFKDALIEFLVLKV